MDSVSTNLYSLSTAHLAVLGSRQQTLNLAVKHPTRPRVLSSTHEWTRFLSCTKGPSLNATKTS